jgi:hypothetical protein
MTLAGHYALKTSSTVIIGASEVHAFCHRTVKASMLAPIKRCAFHSMELQAVAAVKLGATSALAQQPAAFSAYARHTLGVPVIESWNASQADSATNSRCE